MKQKIPPGARRGISLIEGVLYLVIALAVIIGGIIFFQQAQLSNRVNDTSRMVTGLHVQTRAMFRDHASFGEIPLEAYLIKSETVPGQFINAGSYGDRIGSGRSGGGSGGGGGYTPPEGAAFCDHNPDASVCRDGTPTDEECNSDPMNQACSVGGGADEVFGPRPNFNICSPGPLADQPVCDAGNPVTLDSFCDMPDAEPWMCEHLQYTSTGPSDLGAYLWNAQAAPGDGSDPFDMGLVIEHSWGGQVSVYGATNYFDITLWDLPRAACARLATVNGTGEGPLGTGIAEVSFDNFTETYPDFPLDAVEAEQYCDNENNMVRIAYRKNPGSDEPIEVGEGGGGGGGYDPVGPPPWIDENNDGYHDDCEFNDDGMPISCPESTPPPLHG